MREPTQPSSPTHQDADVRGARRDPRGDSHRCIVLRRVRASRIGRRRPGVPAASAACDDLPRRQAVRRAVPAQCAIDERATAVPPTARARRSRTARPRARRTACRRGRSSHAALAARTPGRRTRSATRGRAPRCAAVGVAARITASAANVSVLMISEDGWVGSRIIEKLLPEKNPCAARLRRAPVTKGDRRAYGVALLH